MAKFHIQARLEWEGFEYKNKSYSLDHLKAHEVVYQGNKDTYKFVVTYGLHCFAKDGQPTSIPVNYSDGRESRQVDLERYHASFNLRRIIDHLHEGKLMYETAQEKYFNIDMVNSNTGKVEPYKVCFHFFKENRLMRMHVTSAFFDRTGKALAQRSYSIFKIAKDTKARPRYKGVPKEAQNNK